MDDQEFYSLEENNDQVILVGNNLSSPTLTYGLAHGFVVKSKLNPPARTKNVKVRRPLLLPGLKRLNLSIIMEKKMSDIQLVSSIEKTEGL